METILKNPLVHEVLLIYKVVAFAAQVIYEKDGELIRKVFISENYNELIEIVRKEVFNG